MKHIVLLFCTLGLLLGMTAHAQEIPGEWVVYKTDGEQIVLHLNSGGSGKVLSTTVQDLVAVSYATGKRVEGTFRVTGGYYFTVKGEVSCPIVWTKSGDTFSVQTKGRPTKKVSAELNLNKSARDLSDYGGYRNSVIAQWKRDFPTNRDVKKYKQYMEEHIKDTGGYLETYIPGTYIFRNNKLFPLHKLYGVGEDNCLSIKDFLTSADRFQELDGSDCTAEEGMKMISGLDNKPKKASKNGRSSRQEDDPYATLHWVKDSVALYTGCLTAAEKFKTIPWNQFSTTEDGQYYTLTDRTSQEIYYLPADMAGFFQYVSEKMTSALTRLDEYRQEQAELYKNRFNETLQKMAHHDLSYILNNRSTFFFGVVKNERPFNNADYTPISYDDQRGLISKLFPILDYTIESYTVQEEADCLQSTILLTTGSKKQYRLTVTSHGDGRIYAESFDVNRAENVGSVKLTDEQKEELKRIKEEHKSIQKERLKQIFDVK